MGIIVSKDQDMELQPCPFCGSRDVALHYDEELDYYAVVCHALGCGAEGPPRFSLTDRNEARRAWNQRVKLQSTE